MNIEEVAEALGIEELPKFPVEMPVETPTAPSEPVVMPEFPEVVPVIPKRFEIENVIAIQRTLEDGVLIITADIVDASGNILRGAHGYRPSDPHGLGPVFKEWLEANPTFPKADYIAPTATEQRGMLADLTARQFRLGLIKAGKSLATVDEAIAAMAAGPAKETAQVEWEYATTFSRMHPLIETIGLSLGLTPTEIDTMWSEAEKL